MAEIKLWFPDGIVEYTRDIERWMSEDKAPSLATGRPATACGWHGGAGARETLTGRVSRVRIQVVGADR